MSLMGKCCCGGCTTTATCNCLPSSYQMTFQSFTISTGLGTFTLPAQTVTAYKCCFAYDAGDGYGTVNRIVYRPSLINIGSYTYTNCSPSVTVQIYFLIFFGINLFNANYVNGAYDPCIVSMYYAVFTLFNSPCTICLSTPSVIDANTACHFVGTNENCYDINGNLFSNTFMQDAISSYFDDCACATYNLSNPCCGSYPWLLLDSSTSLMNSQDNQCNLINVNGGLGYGSTFVGSGVPVIFVLS